MKTNWLVAAFLVIGLSSCSSIPDASSIGAFPTSSKPASGGDLAYVTGQLVLKDGCLRLVDDLGDSFLIRWPYGYSYREASETLEILDSGGQFKVGVGSTLGLVGGTEEGGISDVPCAGPVWYAWEVTAPTDTTLGTDR